MLTLAEILSDFAAFLGSAPEVDVTTRGPNGETSLHWMATLGDANAICLLVAAGAGVSATDHKGNTPLHEAVAYRQTPAAKTLIELGANLKVCNVSGQTPQDIAKSDGYSPTIALFAEH